MSFNIFLDEYEVIKAAYIIIMMTATYNITLRSISTIQVNIHQNNTWNKRCVHRLMMDEFEPECCSLIEHTAFDINSYNTYGKLFILHLLIAHLFC